MKYFYDFHIHTALSPCGDEDMTPNNIVNMALLKGLDMIAVTDHNSCENAAAVMKVAEDTELLVVPGMEVETCEEVHMICLFPDLEQALQMQEHIYNNLPPIKNRKEIFGCQWIINERDEKIGENERFLITASKLSVYEVVSYVKYHGGIAFPAHIDRSSYSILANLGFIPPDLEITTVEVSKNDTINTNLCKQKMSQTYHVLQSSDAHYLANISERQSFIELDKKNIPQIISVLNTHKM